MALFGKKQNRSAAADSDGAATAVTQKPVTDVLLQPRITEKAAHQNQDNVYVFNIDPSATKKDVANAIRRAYNVTPRRVNVARVPSKKVRRHGVRGERSGGKKAYVYLKEGDSIELM